jgi:hypothetical protein
MVPDREIALLTKTIEAGVFLAGQGNFAAGYDLLVEGRKRAEQLRERREVGRGAGGAVGERLCCLHAGVWRGAEVGVYYPLRYGVLPVNSPLEPLALSLGRPGLSLFSPGDTTMRRVMQLVFLLAALTWGTLLWRAMEGGESRSAAQIRTLAFAVMFVPGAIAATEWRG